MPSHFFMVTQSSLSVCAFIIVSLFVDRFCTNCFISHMFVLEACRLFQFLQFYEIWVVWIIGCSNLKVNWYADSLTGIFDVGSILSIVGGLMWRRNVLMKEGWTLSDVTAAFNETLSWKDERRRRKRKMGAWNFLFWVFFPVTEVLHDMYGLPTPKARLNIIICLICVFSFPALSKVC